jgi:hypothetical protein
LHGNTLTWTNGDTLTATDATKQTGLVNAQLALAHHERSASACFDTQTAVGTARLVNQHIRACFGATIIERHNNLLELGITRAVILHGFNHRRYRLKSQTFQVRECFENTPSADFSAPKCVQNGVFQAKDRILKHSLRIMRIFSIIWGIVHGQLT